MELLSLLSLTAGFFTVVWGILLLVLLVIINVSAKEIQNIILEAHKTDSLDLKFLKSLLTAKPDTEYVTACNYEHNGKPVNYKSYNWKFSRLGKYLNITVRYYEDKDTKEPIELISYDIYTSFWMFPF
jgi:hypothetical protein